MPLALRELFPVLLSFSEIMAELVCALSVLTESFDIRYGKSNVRVACDTLE